MAWRDKFKRVMSSDKAEQDDVMDAKIEPVAEKAETGDDVMDAKIEPVADKAGNESDMTSPVSSQEQISAAETGEEKEPATAAETGGEKKQAAAAETGGEKEQTEAKKLTQKEKLDARVQANADKIAAKEKIRRDKIEAREKKRTDKILARERERTQKLEAKQRAKADKLAARQKAAAEKLAAEAQKRDDKAAEKRRIADAKKARKEEKAEAKRLKREANRPRRIRNTIIFVLVLAFVLVGGGIFYTRYAEYFQTHFYAGTKINGRDVSYQTVDQVKTALRHEAEQYSLTISEKDDNVEVLSAKDLGWSYVDNHSVDSLMENQHGWKWIKEFSNPQNVKVKLTSSYDKDTVREAIARLNIVTAEPVTPTDAILVVKSDGTYAIHPETEGNEIDKGKLETAIFTALNKEDTKLDIVNGTDCYVHPAVTSDDKTLKARRDELNKYMGLTISYTFGNSTEVIDGNFLKPYLMDNGKDVTLATDWIRPLVMSWAQKYDTFGRELSFTTHTGTEITVPGGGNYGWSLNTADMIDDLTKAVEDAESGSREPIWLIKGQGFENGGLSSTYVEISLGEQKLCLFKDGSDVLETDIISGTPTPDLETKPGVYAVSDVSTDATVDTVTVENYDQPVSGYAAFNGKAGILDAPWRDAFGGDVYKTKGTRGSIYVPEDSIETILATVQEGTPVVIY